MTVHHNYRSQRVACQKVAILQKVSEAKQSMPASLNLRASFTGCQACAAKPPLPTLTAKGIVLGVMEEITLEERQVTLTPGDILILYTDGVTEPINPAGEEFGEERLARIIASKSDQPCNDIVRQIRAAVWDFAGQQTQFDDYTLVGIKRSLGTP